MKAHLLPFILTSFRVWCGSMLWVQRVHESIKNILVTDVYSKQFRAFCLDSFSLSLKLIDLFVFDFKMHWCRQVPSRGLSRSFCLGVFLHGLFDLPSISILLINLQTISIQFTDVFSKSCFSNMNSVLSRRFAKVGVSSPAQPGSLQFAFVSFIEITFPFDEELPPI